MTQQEIELVSYIKERVKFNGACCSGACDYLHLWLGKQFSCDLFKVLNLDSNDIRSYAIRSSDCKKFFN